MNSFEIYAFIFHEADRWFGYKSFDSILFKENEQAATIIPWKLLNTLLYIMISIWIYVNDTNIYTIRTNGSKASNESIDNN